MTKDEAVKKIAREGYISIEHAEELYDSIVNKPAVPQYVADWYENIKEDFENKLFGYIRNFHIFKSRGESKDFNFWFDDNKNAIQTLVNMYQFGYEIEKEKLYTVEFPNPNGDSNRYGLCKVDGRIIIGSLVFGLNKASNAKLTEAEIKKDFDWAWRFAEEVEE